MALGVAPSTLKSVHCRARHNGCPMQVETTWRPCLQICSSDHQAEAHEHGGIKELPNPRSSGVCALQAEDMGIQCRWSTSTTCDLRYQALIATADGAL